MQVWSAGREPLWEKMEGGEISNFLQTSDLRPLMLLQKVLLLLLKILCYD